MLVRRKHACPKKVSACVQFEFQLCSTRNAARRVGRYLKAVKFAAEEVRAPLLGV